jgi:hypothetical protein
MYQAATAVLPRHGRDPDVFLHRLPRLSGEYSREMDAGGQALLPQRSHYPRGKQKGKLPVCFFLNVDADPDPDLHQNEADPHAVPNPSFTHVLITIFFFYLKPTVLQV